MSDTPRTDEWLAEDIEALREASYEFMQEIHGLREQRDVIMGRLSETHMRMTEAEKQRDRLAKALGELIRLDDQMIDPDYEESGTYAGAYYCYYKGERDTWDNAREALAAVKGGTQ
jgi:hypothetical protein